MSHLPAHLAALGFARNPFPQTPDADCHFRTEAIDRQFAEAHHCIVAGKGFVLLTGEIGTGKSTFLRCLIDRLHADGCRTAYVFNTFLKGRDLLQAINRDFGLQPGADMAEDLDRLNHFLIDARTRGQPCVVLLDDAQNFDIDTLELVRLLSNLETRQHKLLQIVLSGQPELAQVLARPEIRQLASRIVQHVQLAPLSTAECARYIAFRIAACIGDAPGIALTDGAQRALYRHAQGNPRRIHLILDRCLYGVLTRRERSIDKPLVRAAVAEAGIAPVARKWPQSVLHSSVRRALLAGVAGGSVMLAAWASNYLPRQHAPANIEAQPGALAQCLQGFGVAGWQALLESGADAGAMDAVARGVAAHGLALAKAQPAQTEPVPHCAWRNAAGHWLLWRPQLSPQALEAGAPTEDVRRLQQYLASAGLYTAPVDGVAGTRTLAALSRWRAAHGLAPQPVLDGQALLLLERRGGDAPSHKQGISHD